jgi:HEAT repeat protein
LIDILKDPEAENKHLALKSLGLLAPRVPGAIPPLAAALGNADPALRKAAARALGSAGPRVKEAVPALNAVLKDEDPSVRIEAAAALRSILGSEASHAVPVLVDLLAQKQAEVRREAAAQLADFGAVAIRSVPALNDAQKDADAGVRSAAAWATARITAAEANQRAAAVMIAALKDKEPRARLDAVRFLGTIGPDARAAIAALTEARLDDSEEVRKAAAEALAKIQVR